MNLSLHPLSLGIPLSCDECNLAHVQVYDAKVEICGKDIALVICALCLSNLGARLQNEARNANCAPR